MSKRIGVFGGAALAAFLTLAATSWADTISYADAVTVLAKDCGNDIKKFCNGENLGQGRIQACLEKNAAKVSPTCTSTLGSVLTSIAQRREAQASVFKVCQHDVSQYCNSVKGDGNILSCLVETKRVDSKACNQAITDAGWR
ncbi:MULTISPECIES: cysteine rich repeat-containing protein [Rhizobium]|uniref:Golgi apparatus protein 1 homolog n=1 Tax=Rhizobium favelukesii TaxID=348824 RepID=W6RIY4_9HYPH|nr:MULTISPECIES: cysteine rich repeat-containing protein [Rhizobium]MCA0802873.1 cysteine rich repeat-containing protein [Rhizobium sp. T1473]MCS0461294.1 cysteine rich repeat-containing protein [Rhizobium favelukesii]UFS83564.1 cysteine rich repeat-containing protein [Rhizobium sp. T136]CDM58838.1 Golgi apparatus protein 1 homolog [Rhizobium favelukesii]